MVADLRYFNSLENEVDTLKSQLETQETQFLNEIDRLSREYYYADHMNAILGVYTDLDEVTNLQCDYLETWEKCEHLEKELSKSRTMSKSFEALQKHAINLELDLQQLQTAMDVPINTREPKQNVNQSVATSSKKTVATDSTIKKFRNTTRKIYEQIKLYKTREDKELDKVITLEKKVKVLNDIVYKTGQFVQTMNMLNRNGKTSFAKPEFLKKAQRANPHLYDIGCYNDNLALMLAPESDETIHLDK
ncbi:hypothetical protein Tco_1043514 [Tanacetum coccineum]|uniref:Uncharacterized protein n=1 Tax=Tanacetum coccineum TaxID=301880 RepID=A0ABQ5GNK6_9ASTR